MAGGKTVSLVLGAGGARGLAHIGVIRCLEESGYRIRYIAGSSIGALIGGIHACGKLAAYEQWARALRQRDVLRLLDLSFSRSSLFKGERIISVLEELVGPHLIEDLPVGFTAVATSLKDQREVWFNRGPLFHAIRASIAIPGIFAPVRDGDRMLVDGGLINPVPIAPAMNAASDLLIAVSLDGRHTGSPVITEAAEEPGEAGLLASLRTQREAISRFISRLLPDDGQRPAPGEPDFVDLMTGTMELNRTLISRLKLAAYTPDVVIELPRNLCEFYEFYRAEQVIDYGYRRARAVLGGA